MSQSLDLTQFPDTEPSICISYVFTNVRRQQVWEGIKESNLGFIERVDMVKMTGKDGKSFQRVFIHFKHWFRNQRARDTRTKLINGGMVKLFYNDPWFWKLTASRSKKPDAGTVLGPKRSKVRLDLSDDTPSDTGLSLGDFIKPGDRPTILTSPTSSMASSPGGTRRWPYSPDASPKSDKSFKKKVPPPINTDLDQSPLPPRKRAPASS
jgi:hypothetical protein